MSIPVFSGKCSQCSCILHKKKYFACSECGQFICKDDFRLHPDSQVTYCVSCYETCLKNDVFLELEPELKSIKSNLFKSKEKLKQAKREKNEKIQTIERLRKLVSNIDNLFIDKLNNLKDKVSQENENMRTKTQAINDLGNSVRELNEMVENEKIKLQEINQEHLNELRSLECIHQENATLRTNIQDIHKEIKNRVPYDRLRSLACEECKSRIKKKFRNEILAANVAKGSVVESVLKQRMSARPSVVPSNSAKAGAAGPKEACCLIT